MRKALLLLAIPFLVLAPASLASAGSSNSNELSIFANDQPSVFTLANLPKGYHIASLGDLYHDANKGRVPLATVDTAINVVLFKTTGPTAKKYAAQYVAGDSKALVARLLAQNVNVTVSTSLTLLGAGNPGNPWYPPLIAVGVIMVFIYILVAYRSAKGWKFWRWRKSPARVGVHLHNSNKIEDVPDVTFDDVAGADEAVASLREMVDFLKDPERYERVGATRPKGALLVGPPGTGKTLLARAVAGEANVPFFPMAGSDFAEMYVGVGARRIRDLFDKARKAKGGSAIIFIDEIDAVARKRSGASHQSGADSERDGTITALLTQLDGFTGSRVMVLAATNRPDILDPAVTRPGRLDRRIEVPNPDRRGRETILKVHVASRPLDPSVDLSLIASRTSGFSGADLANVVNEAAIGTARRDGATLLMGDFDSAIMTTIMGRARVSAVVTDHDRTITAWHEAGHTVTAFLQEAADPPVSVSIVPRGPAGGVTAMSEGDNLFMRRSKAAAQLVVALGGRVAEELIFGGDYTQGASNDLAVATELATQMVSNYAMTSLGLSHREIKPYDTATDHVTLAVEDLLAAARAESLRLLRTNAVFLRIVADGLLAQGTLDHLDLERLYLEAASPPHVTTLETLAAIYGPEAAVPGELASSAL